MLTIPRLIAAAAVLTLLIGLATSIYKAGVNSQKVETAAQKQETRNANDKTIRKALDAGRAVRSVDGGKLPNDDPFRRPDGE